MPYSFSTWTMMTQPPRVHWCLAIMGMTWSRYLSTYLRYSGSSLLMRGRGSSKLASFVSQAGKPPKSHSAQMYGPGRTMANIPCLSHSDRNSSRSRSPLKSNRPSSASWKFQATYVSTAFMPPRRAFCILSAHSSLGTRKKCMQADVRTTGRPSTRNACGLYETVRFILLPPWVWLSLQDREGHSVGPAV